MKSLLTFGVRLAIVMAAPYLSESVFARPPIRELAIRSDYQLESDGLTTDQINALDPKQINPHYLNWLLVRKAEINGLTSITRKDNLIGVEAEGLLVSMRGYVRPSGPWYYPFSSFNCDASPDSWFQTQEGARWAVSQASEIWMHLLEEEKVKLSLLLERVSAKSKTEALDLGEKVFRVWLDSVDQAWRSQVFSKVRKQEWKNYLATAKAEKSCPVSRAKRTGAPSIRSRMEPLTGPTPTVTRILARAPAKLWNGLFSVRLDLLVGGKPVTGKFLIDSGAPRSVVSPVWLESQGVIPGWVTQRSFLPARVQWSVDEKDGLTPSPEGSLAPWAHFEQVRMAGFDLPIKDFLLADTDFFFPPETLSSCCDGVLGVDFLRSYPMEFQSKAPAEVRIWPREGFHWDASEPWMEVHETPSGDVVSDCSVQTKDKHRFSGLAWLSGSTFALQIHQPFQSLGAATKTWDIACDGVTLAVDLRGKVSSSTQRYPGAAAGIAVLSQGSHANFTWDLPHGRLWFSGEPTGKFQMLNRSGLVLKFRTHNGERELVVEEIRPGTPAAKLLKIGLKKGEVIAELDNIETSDLDQWQVDRHLSGEFGDQVSLQWNTGNGIKMAPLAVRGLGTVSR